MQLRFRPDIAVLELSEETISFSFPHAALKWHRPHASLQKCLHSLISGESEERLYNQWEASPPEFFYLLEKLKILALLSTTVLHQEKPLATLFPRIGFEAKSKPLEAAAPLQLSRFAYMRAKDGSFLLESPLTKAEIHLQHPKCLEIIHTLSEPRTMSALAQQCPELSPPTLHSFLSLLHQASFLHEEDESPQLVTWEFHDLLFHAKSRKGRNSDPSGGTLRFLGKMPPSPAIRPLPSSKMIPLFQPDMSALRENDLLFSRVLETRKSIREQGGIPISFTQISEFLYRSVRVKEHRKSQHYDTTCRPYPGGGACYELELYPLIYRCEGISPALYRYHPESHALCLCSEWNANLEQLLQDACRSTGKKELPQILILIAARFQRISWKYQSMAYALILKDAGILLQTMYLVATAMDLAPCAIGGGDADLFAKAAGTDYYEETTVAEFILGSKRK